MNRKINRKTRRSLKGKVIIAMAMMMLITMPTAAKAAANFRFSLAIGETATSTSVQTKTDSKGYMITHVSGFENFNSGYFTTRVWNDGITKAYSKTSEKIKETGNYQTSYNTVPSSSISLRLRGTLSTTASNPTTMEGTWTP